jgi:alpha-1,3-rhamnosyl/mannosyltransferase
VDICLDCTAAGPGASGIGAYARSALEALCSSPGDGDRLVILKAGEAGRLRLPAHFQVVTPSASAQLWHELELPALLEERGVAVLFSPLFACPVVRGARYVVTLHDVLPESHPELCTPEFMALWKSRLGSSLRSACHAVAVSEWSKAQAVERLKLDPARVSVVRQSVGGHFRPVLRAEAEPVLAARGLGWGQYVLYVGALDPRKNLERLIRAFAALDSAELTLALAGRAAVAGYDLGAVAAKAGLAGRARLLGYVPDAELPALYSGARCFAFPSLAEGFGRPCIEAMACGVPVVASGATALPDTCSDAALLPDAGDEAAIAGALRAACFDDAVRARLAAAGAKRAGEFTPEKFAAGLLGAFESALAGPGEGLWRG